jgi:hypothetical protein
LSSFDTAFSDNNQQLKGVTLKLPSIFLSISDGKFGNNANFDNILKVMVDNHKE